MKCDKCGVSLTISNNGDFAPYGIPLYVCKSCYNKLKESEKIHKRSKNMSGEVCSDNRFEIIEKVKNHLIESTNITQKELEVVDSILFRLWQLRYFENVEVEE
jgi:DNA-directed RNA polymerase subunit M/transcription elongation factor TFIIS